jgi:hypothetical protein
VARARVALLQATAAPVSERTTRIAETHFGDIAASHALGHKPQAGRDGAPGSWSPTRYAALAYCGLKSPICCNAKRFLNEYLRPPPASKAKAFEFSIQTLNTV